MSQSFMQTNVRLSPSDMNDFSLRDRHTFFSTTIGEHHVQNLITLKLDEIKIFRKIYMTIPTVTQPYSATWMTLFAPYIIL